MVSGLDIEPPDLPKGPAYILSPALPIAGTPSLLRPPIANPRVTEEWKNAILKITEQDPIKRKRKWNEKQWTWLATASQIEESFLIEWHKRLSSSVNNAV